MSSSPEREKDLPAIPVDTDVSGTVAVDYPIPSSNIAISSNTNKSLPSIKVENSLSEEEIRRLHELWNGTGLSARAHRRRFRDQNPVPRRIPSPISILQPDDVPPTLLVPSAGSITSTTPSTGTRKRWGFLSARPFSETQETEKKAPKTLEKLRAMAQDRLKRKLRYAKSAPNLGDQVAPLRRVILLQPAVPIPVEAMPKDEGRNGLRDRTSPGKTLTPEVIVQREDKDENAIYFTIDPNWRASRGSVQLECITPIPDNATSLERPDSPLLHRHHSLDQLSFAAQQTTAMEFPELYSRHEVPHPVDELHSYLEL